MKAIKFISVIFSTIVLFAACTKDDVTKETLPREELVLSGTTGVAEEVRPFTRADQEAFKPGEELMVIVRDKNNPGKFLVAGDKTTIATTGAVDGKKNALDCDPVLFWDDLGGTGANLELFGVYPHDATVLTGDIVTWEVADNQTTYPIEKELMFAQEDKDNTGYSYNDSKSASAHLNFEHMLTKITITIDVNDDDGFDANTLSNAKVTFKNIPLKANYGIIDNSCNFTDNEKSTDYEKATMVTPSKVMNTDTESKAVSYSYTILCAPHGYKKGKVLGEIAVKGNTYKIVVSKKNVDEDDELNFNRGKHTVITVKLRGSDVTATASLTDWDNVTDIDPVDSQIITFEDFTINDIGSDKNVLTSGSTINMTFTDKASSPHKAVFTYDGTKWIATKPVYWDDITTAITKVDALLTIEPSSGTKTGEHYFSGSLEREFTKSAAIAGNSQINLDGPDNEKFFTHPLSKVDITITTSDDTDKITIKDIKASGNGVVIKGKVIYKLNDELTDLEQAANEDLDITNRSNADDATTHVCVTAYIWPQDLIELCQVTVGENVYKVQANRGSNYPFAPGKHYTFTVKITKTGVSATASLKDWETVTVPDIETGL